MFQYFFFLKRPLLCQVKSSLVHVRHKVTDQMSQQFRDLRVFKTDSEIGKTGRDNRSLLSVKNVRRVSVR